MANVDVTTADVMIDQAWTPELNRGVELDIVIAALFEDKSAQLRHGDTLNMPASHNLTANTKSAGVALTPEAITETQQQFTVSTHQAIAQQIEDIAEIQSRYDLRAETTNRGAYALARAMDVAGGNLFDDNTTQTVGTLGAELSYTNFLDGRTLLRNSAAKGRLCMVVAPATYSGLLNTEQFVNAMYNGDTKGMAVREAQCGKIFKTTVYESQLTPGTSPNSSGAWFAHGHFFKIIQRRPTTHTWYSPLDVSWVVSMDQLYGMFERQEADEAAAATTTARLWGVRLQSKK